MRNKYFIITVDTEGDNLWDYKKGDKITTINTKYLPRFQNLCDKFGLKPVYLTNYEMANDDEFVNNAKVWLESDRCEIGLHLHAWNTPPIYELSGPYDYNPYLIEFPEDVMYEKFKTIYDLLAEKFSAEIVSHRAGRWAMDERYFKILNDIGIKVDCSMTPGMDWSHNVGVTRGGSDYRNSSTRICEMGGILEVPMTIRQFRHITNGTVKHRVKTLLKGENVWLRPASHPLKLLKILVDRINREAETDYLEFMIHSSELMPGGSPYFKTEESIENLYDDLEHLFDYISRLGYSGVTLKEYYENRSKWVK